MISAVIRSVPSKSWAERTLLLRRAVDPTFRAFLWQSYVSFWQWMCHCGFHEWPTPLPGPLINERSRTRDKHVLRPRATHPVHRIRPQPSKSWNRFWVFQCFDMQIGRTNCQGYSYITYSALFNLPSKPPLPVGSVNEPHRRLHLGCTFVINTKQLFSINEPRPVDLIFLLLYALVQL